MKEALAAPPALRKGIYGKGVPIYVTVDTSPTGIGWVINQEDENGARFPIRFGAKVLSERQRGYTKVKRELWGIVSTVKADRDYLIEMEVIGDGLPTDSRYGFRMRDAGPGYAQVDRVH
jgi:hypothetical protein